MTSLCWNARKEIVFLFVYQSLAVVRRIRVWLRALTHWEGCHATERKKFPQFQRVVVCKLQCLYIYLTWLLICLHGHNMNNGPCFHNYISFLCETQTRSVFSNILLLEIHTPACIILNWVELLNWQLRAWVPVAWRYYLVFILGRYCLAGAEPVVSCNVPLVHRSLPFHCAPVWFTSMNLKLS